MAIDTKVTGNAICVMDKVRKFIQMDHIMWVLGHKIKKMGKENYILILEL
jgi:hypothetical protein